MPELHQGVGDQCGKHGGQLGQPNLDCCRLSLPCEVLNLRQVIQEHLEHGGGRRVDVLLPSPEHLLFEHVELGRADGAGRQGPVYRASCRVHALLQSANRRGALGYCAGGQQQFSRGGVGYASSCGPSVEPELIRGAVIELTQETDRCGLRLVTAHFPGRQLSYIRLRSVRPSRAERVQTLSCVLQSESAGETLCT